MNAHRVSWIVIFVAGLLGISTISRAQSYTPYAWHYLLTDAGRNAAIFNTAVRYPIGSYGGECKVWVQNIVWAASNGACYPPQNMPGCDWMWLWSPNAYIVAQDRWNGVSFMPGQIIQAQVRANFWPYTSPHTMIVLAASPWYITVIESNYYYPERVDIRTTNWPDFQRSVLHYTLYQIK